MCQSTSPMESAIVSCSGSILSALHPPPLQHQEALKPAASTVTPPGIHRREKIKNKMADRYPEMWELSSCELGHARRVAVRTRRYFSSWHQAHGTAGCAIAHWRDASTEKTIIVVPNSSWCLLCATLKIAFCSKSRSATHNCAEADVIVTSCSCIETVLRTHTWLPQPRCCAVICPPAVNCTPLSFTMRENFYYAWNVHF